MVLDPMSAISLAATIVQFVDFSSKIVSKGYHLYGSADGALPENEQLGYVITDLKTLNSRLRHGRNLGSSSKDEKALEEMSLQCAAIADELLAKLGRLKVPQDASFRKWKSFRQALKSFWTKEELDKMAATLSEYRSQLELHILVSLRETHDLMAIQQNEQFDRLDDRQQEIIKLLQARSSPFTEVLKAQNVAIATLGRETRDHVTKEHERTRAEIIQAINERKPSYPISSTEVFPTRTRRKKTEEEVRPMVEQALLRSLKFPSMSDRYYGIEDAHSKTFHWVLEPPDAVSQPWNDLSNWLAHGDHIYWINGKAGSGKSTLMRYVYEHERTSRFLQQWASSSGGLISAGFFFWKSGVPDQASQSGLLRSLLHSLLDQKREVLPAVFPEEWKSLVARAKVTATTRLELEEDQKWSVRQLRIALEGFFRLKLQSRVCIFVDGLDEYSGDPSETIMLIKKIASKDVKFCLSSRPWVEFNEAFKAYPGLKLQDLTYDDIRLYVEGHFEDDNNMAELSKQTPGEARNFVEEIVVKADGVFLWVKLVVRSLLAGMLNGDRIIELQQRLDELPSDLETLYAHMLATINPRYFVEGCQIFQMMQTLQNLKMLPNSRIDVPPFCALTLSFALEESEADMLSFPKAPLPTRKVAERVERVEKRLKVCCAGLLEFPIEKRATVQSRNLILRHQGNTLIQYIHRTALDFLSEDVVWKQLLDATRPTKFNANTSLLKSYILRLKTDSMVDLKGYNCAGLFSPHMTLAYYADKEVNPPSIALLDELAKTLSQVRPEVEEKLAIMGLKQTWPSDFLISAVRYPLFNYLIVKFALPSRIPRSPLGHSYLHYALRDADRAQPITVSESIIALLLPYSSTADIQEGWIMALKNVADRRGTYWKLPWGDEAQMWIAILRLFIEYGANPRAKITIMMPPWEPSEEEYKTYSAAEVVSLLGAELPKEVAELLALMKRKRGSIRHSGLFGKLRKMREVVPPLPDVGGYPERTWWREEKT